MKNGQSNYYPLVFALAAKITNNSSSNPRSFDEVLGVFQQGLELSQSVRSECEKSFLDGQNSDSSVTDIAQTLRLSCLKRPHVLARALMGLLQLCAKSDTIPKLLDDELRQIAAAFDFDAEVYEKLRAHFVKGELSCSLQEERLDVFASDSEAEFLVIVGCGASSSNIDIRRAYRHLALTNHPDVYQAINLDSTVKKDIARRFNQIQIAYESLKKLRGIK